MAELCSKACCPVLQDWPRRRLKARPALAAKNQPSQQRNGWPKRWRPPRQPTKLTGARIRRSAREATLVLGSEPKVRQVRKIFCATKELSPTRSPTEVTARPARSRPAPSVKGSTMYGSRTHLTSSWLQGDECDKLNHRPVAHLEEPLTAGIALASTKIFAKT